MSEETKNQVTEGHVESPKTVVEVLLDLGASWAAHGLNAGKFSLENSARMLEKTAKSLEGLARELEKKGNRRSTKGEAA